MGVSEKERRRLQQDVGPRRKIDPYLHTCVIHNHLFVFDIGIFLRNFTSAADEQTIGKFHNVCLVHSCDLLSIVTLRVIKGKLCHSSGCVSCDDFQGFHNPWDDFMFEPRILSFGVFSAAAAPTAKKILYFR